MKNKDNEITLTDLLATESEVLNKIASDIQGTSLVKRKKGHNSITGAHNSGTTHNCHTSGVISEKLKKIIKISED